MDFGVYAIRISNFRMVLGYAILYLGLFSAFAVRAIMSIYLNTSAIVEPLIQECLRSGESQARCNQYGEYQVSSLFLSTSIIMFSFLVFVIINFVFSYHVRNGPIAVRDYYGQDLEESKTEEEVYDLPPYPTHANLEDLASPPPVYQQNRIPGGPLREQQPVTPTTPPPAF